MVSLRRLLCVPLALLASHASAAKDITDLFQVGFSSRNGGNCAAYGKDRLNTLVTEALGLLDAGIRAVDDAKVATGPTSDAAFRVLYTFFHEPTSSDWDYIKKFYQDVQRFLNNGGNTNNGAQTLKPWLFCGDSWSFRQDMTSQMYDASATKMTKADGTPYLIQDNPDYVKAQRDGSAAQKTTLYPYYSEELGQYAFLQKYGNDPTAGYCAGAQGHQGGTIPRSGNGLFSFMILCPGSFTNKRVRSVAASPMDPSAWSNGNEPTGAQRLTAVQPEVATFLHELFHLVWGNALTNPDPDEEYRVRRMLRADYTKENALKNPESYTNMAIAYDYTINSPKQNNLPVEFYTGWCSFEKP